MSNDFEESLMEAVLEELDGTSSTFSELVMALRRRGALGPLEPYDDDQVAKELDYLLLDTDEVWTTNDGFIAKTSSMLDGLFFSHEVTAAELDRSSLEVVPDFIALGFEMDDGLAYATGGRLHNEIGDDLESDRDDLVGPPGWLDDVAASELLVISRRNRTATVIRHSSPESGDREAQALLASFELVHEEGVMDDATQVVLDTLCRDRTLFRSPVAPIRDLLEQVGLECDGEWVQRRGEVAEPPGVIYRRHRIAEITESFDFDRCCSAPFELVLAAWSDFVVEGSFVDDARRVAQALAHEAVSPAFVEYVLAGADTGSRRLEEFAGAVASLNGRLSAPGIFLLALNAERDARTLEAERLLKLASMTDDTFLPALSQLSWYESDRGHFSAAISLLRRAGFEEGDTPIENLRSLMAISSPKAGRNDTCPCGSGRKFKVCCLFDPKLTPSQVREVLHHKIMQFSFRRQNAARMRDVFDVAMHYADENRSEGLAPFLVDLVAYNPAALVRFIDTRGPLLPEVERLLVLEWMGARRSLWQILEVTAGTSIRLLDTCSGDVVDVSERTASQTLQVGDYLFARLMEEGDQWAIESEILLVPVQHRASLIEVLDEGGDPLDLAAWLGGMFGPITMVNYEGEEIVMCRAVLAPTLTPWSTLRETLDRIFQPIGDDQWNETVETERSPAVRCFLSRVDDTLVVVTNSVERLERVLGLLSKNVADLHVLEDERSDIATAREKRRADGGDLGMPDEPAPFEVREVMKALMREKEEAWIDESIPALAGLTPRQAASDPTRREDLVAVLNEFDRRDVGQSGFAGFDVARLRHILGVSRDA
ncbi:MAG TPA: SEC-C metal-binding domain-containing protein [Acidimicrobiales bacterium]